MSKNEETGLPSDRALRPDEADAAAGKMARERVAMSMRAVNEAIAKGEPRVRVDSEAEAVATAAELRLAGWSVCIEPLSERVRVNEWSSSLWGPVGARMLHVAPGPERWLRRFAEALSVGVPLDGTASYRDTVAAAVGCHPGDETWLAAWKTIAPLVVADGGRLRLLGDVADAAEAEMDLSMAARHVDRQSKIDEMIAYAMQHRGAGLKSDAKLDEIVAFAQQTEAERRPSMVGVEKSAERVVPSTASVVAESEASTARHGCRWESYAGRKMALGDAIVFRFDVDRFRFVLADEADVRADVTVGLGTVVNNYIAQIRGGKRLVSVPGLDGYNMSATRVFDYARQIVIHDSHRDVAIIHLAIGDAFRLNSGDLLRVADIDEGGRVVLARDDAYEGERGVAVADVHDLAHERNGWARVKDAGLPKPRRKLPLTFSGRPIQVGDMYAGPDDERLTAFDGMPVGGSFPDGARVLAHGDEFETQDATRIVLSYGGDSLLKAISRTEHRVCVHDFQAYVVASDLHVRVRWADLLFERDGWKRVAPAVATTYPIALVEKMGRRWICVEDRAHVRSIKDVLAVTAGYVFWQNGEAWSVTGIHPNGSVVVVDDHGSRTVHNGPRWGDYAVYSMAHEIDGWKFDGTKAKQS